MQVDETATYPLVLLFQLFDGDNFRNGASYALDQCRTLMGNRIWQIESFKWCHLRALAATGSAQNCVSEFIEFGRRYRVQRLARLAISASAE